MEKYFKPMIVSSNHVPMVVHLQSYFAITGCNDVNGCAALEIDFGDLTPPVDGYQFEVTCLGSYVDPGECQSPSVINNIENPGICSAQQLNGSVYQVNCCFSTYNCDMDTFDNACSGDIQVRVLDSESKVLGEFVVAEGLSNC